MSLFELIILNLLRINSAPVMNRGKRGIAAKAKFDGFVNRMPLANKEGLFRLFDSRDSERLNFP
jgi:hypothetical protein